MERLDFTLPDFVRTSWVSDSTRETWEHRFARIQEANQQVEWLSAAEGLRRCALTTATPESFITRGGEWARHGLSALPVFLQNVSQYTYSNRIAKPEAGQPFAFRIVLGKPADVAEFQAAWDGHDNQRMGELLGYPQCCTDFFQQVWVDLGMTDTTWPMAIASLNGGSSQAEADKLAEVSGPPEANILWRWMGLRAVPHLPCKFDCQATVEFARRWIALGRDTGYRDEMEWLLEILSWPVEWSALHGIAEVKTPVLKVSTQTDATPSRYVVRYKGDRYPAEGANGLVFPYTQPDRLHFSSSEGFQRGLQNPIAAEADTPEWYAGDNGFSSRFAMDSAHQPVMEQVLTALPDGGRVLDLGCGNGALLAKLHAANPKIIPYGVDHDPIHIEHAGELLPEYLHNFYCGNIFDIDRIWEGQNHYDMVLLMPGRLLETTAEKSERLKLRIVEQCERLVVYAYGDWLTRYQNLGGLVEAAGLTEFVLHSNGDTTGSNVAEG